MGTTLKHYVNGTSIVARRWMPCRSPLNSYRDLGAVGAYGGTWPGRSGPGYFVRNGWGQAGPLGRVAMEISTAKSSRAPPAAQSSAFIFNTRYHFTKG